MIKKIKSKNLDVFSTFLERKEALPIYNKIKNTISGNTIYENTEKEVENDHYLYCIYDFPSYLKGHIDKNGWKLKCINTYKGSLILLKNYKDINDYLKKKFKTPKRFRIYKSKLEACFNIEYKTYFGAISRDEYDYLFKEFQNMLKQRFLEKKIENYDLSRWNVYHEIAYPLIINKEAVLFVIYNENKPISFYLNLLKNKTIYGYIKSYDINYSKFSVGFTNFLQQLHWSFENDIEVYDLLKGNYPYKSKLIDQQYYYQKQIIYNCKSPLTVISAKIIIIKTRSFYALVKFFKKLNLDRIYHQFIKYKYRNRELNMLKNKSQNILLENGFKVKSSKQLQKIDLDDESFIFLKRTAYTFLYHNLEHISTVKVYKIKNEVSAYFIEGKKQTQKITFQ